MKLWGTEIRAIDPITGDLKLWGGPNVPGITRKDAEDYCQKNGLGFCKIIDELIAEIPCKEGTMEPDWNRMVDYETEQLN